MVYNEGCLNGGLGNKQAILIRVTTPHRWVASDRETAG